MVKIPPPISGPCALAGTEEVCVAADRMYERSPIHSDEGTLWLARRGSGRENVFVPEELRKIIVDDFMHEVLRAMQAPHGGPTP